MMTPKEQIMASKVNPIPSGFHTATPYLTLNDAARAIDFYKRAFGAQVAVRMDLPGGKIGHAEIKIGDSIIMLSDEMPGAKTRSPQALGGTTSSVFLYFPDVDATFKQAVAAGGIAVSQPQDMFWGDRFGTLTDPFGHVWSMATHKEDVSPEEMKKRSAEAMAQMAQQHPQTKSAH